MIRFWPTRGKILCEIISNEFTSPGGIVFVKTLKEKPSRGKVIAAGGPIVNTCDKCEDRKVCRVRICWKKNKELSAPCRKGDMVYFKPVYNRAISENVKTKEKYIFIDFMDVIGVAK